MAGSKRQGTCNLGRIGPAVPGLRG